MKNKIKNSHIFALFCQNLPVTSSQPAGHTITIPNENLWRRITAILRLTAGEHVILFDTAQHIEIELGAETFKKKNSIHATIINTAANKSLTPAVTLMPALLKKEAFEMVAYLAAQMGATQIQPLITTKVQRSWGGTKERERLTNIMVAAAEQSKNFILPTIHEPLELNQLKKDSSIFTIFFEETGQPFMDTARQMEKVRPQNIRLIFGPEGGLTIEEQQYLITHEFLSCMLTPTILRAQEAVAVGLGMIRSLNL